MSTELQHDCPHCVTRSAGFIIFGQWLSPLGLQYANLVAVCRVCSGGLLLLSYDTSGTSHIDLRQFPVNYPANRYRIVETWPKSGHVNIEHVPDNISQFYQQASENLKSQRWDAAGVMFRKTLDVATKTIDPQLKSISLYRRIGILVESNMLTSAMGEWAHEIRLDGNDAVHDDEPETHADALASQKFTEAFLTYVFSLPKLVELNRVKRDLTAHA